MMHANNGLFGLRRGVWPLLVCELLLVALAACHGSSSLSDVEARKASVDSVLRGISHTDSLAVLAHDYEHNGDKQGAMIAYNYLGKNYRHHSRFDEAITAHNSSLRLAWELADTIEAVRALNNLGTDYRRLGILDEAATCHYRALNCCEQYSDKTSEAARKNRVVSLNGLGNLYMTLENYAAADSVLRAALEGEKSLGSELGQAINYANLGAIMESRERMDSAWFYYRKSLELNTAAGSELGKSLCHTHFGSLYEKAGDLDMAVAEYDIAYNLMRNTDDQWHWLEVCQALAQVHIKRGDMQHARQYVTQADSIATQIHSLEHLAVVNDLSYQIARRQGNIQQALDYFIRSRQFQDSLINSQKVNHLHNLRIKYEQNRRKEEIDNINRIYDSERHFKNMLLLVGLLLLLMAVGAIAFLVYSLRMRSKHQQLMAQMEETRSSFFTNVTHEFRTPLTIIMGLAQELNGNDVVDPKTMRSHAQSIMRQGGNLLDLVNQLLDISKVQSAVGAPDWRSGDIVAFVSMIVNGYQEMCHAKRIDITFAAREPSVTMDFVPHYVQRVMNNLISNSVKFTPSYGQIYVTMRADAGKLHITVADTGTGIDKVDLPHVFETFYQSKRTPRIDVGSGVGLSLVRQMVMAMDGDMEVHSSPGEGTVFELHMPMKHGIETLKAVDVEQYQLPTPPAPLDETVDATPIEDEKADDSRPLILIVEDHADVASYIGQQLRGQYTIQFAGNGREALNKATDTVPDLIVTDLMMPEMDGYELCRQVRASALLCHIPIIVVTARATEADRIAGIAAGADAYLLKPFNADELRIRIDKLLEQRRMLRSMFAQDYTDSDYNPNEPFTGGDRKFLDHLIDIVNREIEGSSRNRIDIDRIASGMNMSTSQLRRKVLALTGLNTMSYVNQVRMSKAKHLLEEDAEMPIGEVAERCGFYDMAHFSRMFKQHHGITPTQFRARLT
ncbi:MAG: response regulator [Muribaculaceae bacterium]|nr:response regulator [Muribaculaceae bacterium]